MLNRESISWLLVCLAGSRGSSKVERIERNRLLKENRNNPDLEKLARTEECM